VSAGSCHDHPLPVHGGEVGVLGQDGLLAGDEVVLSAHGNIVSVATAVGAVVGPRALEWSAPVAGRMVARIDDATRMEIWIGLDLDLIDDAVVPTIAEMDAPVLRVAAALAA
jgi:hypothetical protein